MLFPDIKSYFIEQETESKQSENYLEELEYCSLMDQMIQIVADYYRQDDFEAAFYILNIITK